MLGFSALSEAPISATAEAQLPLVIVPIGAIGASPIGVYAIGQASITTGGTGVSDGDASAALVVVNVSSPAPTVSASSVASETGFTITVSAPEATLSVSVTASVTIPEITVTAPASTETGSAISEAQAATIALTPAEAAVTGAAEATFADLIEIGITAPTSEAQAPVTALAQSNTIVVTSPEPSVTTSSTANPASNTINVFTPTARVDGIEVPDALPLIQVSSPTVSASVDVQASATGDEVDVTEPSASATGSAVAEADSDQVDVTAPDANANGINIFVPATINSVNVVAPEPTPAVDASASADLVTVTVSSPEPTVKLITTEDRDNALLTSTTVYAGFVTFDYEWYDTGENNNYQIVHWEERRAVHLKNSTVDIVSLNDDGSINQLIGTSSVKPSASQIFRGWSEYTSATTLNIYAFAYEPYISTWQYVIYKTTANIRTGTFSSWAQTSDYDPNLIGIASPDFVEIDGEYRYALPFTGVAGNSSLVTNYVIYTYYTGATNSYRYRIVDINGNDYQYNFPTKSARDNAVLDHFDGTIQNDVQYVAFESLTKKLPYLLAQRGDSAAQASADIADVYNTQIPIINEEQLIETNYDGDELDIAVTSPVVGATGLITTALPQITVTPPQAIAGGEGSVTATATIPQVTVGSPQSENTVSSTAQAVSSTVTVSAPTSFETVVEIPLAKPPVIVTSPEPTVSGSSQADSNGVTIAVTPPEAGASQGSVASSQLVIITVSAPDANGSGSSLAESESNTVTVSAPETTETVVDEPALPVITITAPTAVASAQVTVANAELVEIAVTAPEAQINLSGNASASIPEITIAQIEAEAFEYQPDPDRTIIVPLENRALEVESEAGRLSVVEFENRIIVVT